MLSIIIYLIKKNFIQKVLFTHIIIFCGTHAFSQDNFNNYKSRVDSLLQVFNYTNKLDSIYKLSHDASLFFYRKKDYKKAIEYSLVEIQLGRSVIGDQNYKNGLYNLGRFYYKMKQYDTSIAYYKKVIDSFSIDKKTYQAYCEIGSNYNKKRDYFQAVSYYEKGLSQPEILTNSLYGRYLNYAIVLNNINTKQSLDRELSILTKADSIGEIMGLSYQRKFNLNNLFALFYKNHLTPDYKKAYTYYKKNLELSLQKKDTFNLVTTYNNLGVMLNKSSNDSAKHYLQRGLTLFNQEDELRSQLYLNLAESNSNSNNYNQALSNAHMALQSLLPITIDSSHNSIIDFNDAIIANNKALVLEILTDKATYYINHYSTTNNISHIKLALKNLEIADELINSIRLESFENDSKLIWQENASIIYMLAVKASHILKDHDLAFYYMEKNKAILLLENISEDQLKKRINLPKELLKKDYNYKQTISALEIALEKSNTNIDSLQELYYSSKIDYSNFINSLKKDYAAFYNYKTPINILNLSDFQNQLDDNTLVIEYILDDLDGYILAITKTQNHLYQLNDLTNLQLVIQQYLNSISKPFVYEKDVTQTDNLSSHLYTILMPYLKKSDFKDKQKLIIVPDYTLQNIPFETLKGPKNRYVILDYQIAYAYSMSFLIHNAAIKRKPTNTFIGFAPETFNYDSLGALKNSITEVSFANSLFNGDTFINEYATKQTFLSSIKDQQIIHLSTHANANDSISPWIAFKNEKLYLNEIHTTKNQAELVVLSACKTSLGGIKKGEGVFSLARGFFYSGANSVVSSLWNVNDKSTQEITSSFYTHLEGGKTKGAALRVAKLDYLKNHSHSELSPYYWASLILIGDSSQIDTLPNYILNFIILICLLILLFFIKKKVLG